VILKSAHGKYVCAEDNQKTVHANRAEAKGWETFELIPQGHNRFALKSHWGKYVCAEQNGTVVADRTKIGGWEQFTVHEEDNKFTFLSAHGKFLSAQQDGTLEGDRRKGPRSHGDELGRHASSFSATAASSRIWTIT